MRAIIIESNFVIILKVRSLTLSAAAVEVGHVVEEDVGRYGHLLFAALHVPVRQRHLACSVHGLDPRLEVAWSALTSLRALVLQVIIRLREVSPPESGEEQPQRKQ